MNAVLESLGGGAQVLRGLLGLAFPYLLAWLPDDESIRSPLIIAGVFSYIAARWLLLFEPKTLLDMGGSALGHAGEAIFVSLGLVIALMLLDQSGVPVGLGGGVVIVVVYLILHIGLLPVLVMHRLKGAGERRERPQLRRFIRGAAFVAGETVALLTIGLALHEHDLARQGPGWTLWDVTPVMPVVFLVVGYAPIIWLEMAATRQRVSKPEEVHGAVEATILQAGAVVVSAMTGSAPWF